MGSEVAPGENVAPAAVSGRGPTLGRLREIERGDGAPPTEEERAAYEAATFWFKTKIVPQLTPRLRRQLGLAGQGRPLRGGVARPTRVPVQRPRERRAAARTRRVRAPSRLADDGEPDPVGRIPGFASASSRLSHHLLRRAAAMYLR